MSTLVRNSLCSSFNGKAKPLMMDPNLEKLGDTVEALCLVDELEEDVVDGSADVGAEVEEFAVYAMERSLQEVAFPGVFRVE